MAVFQVSKLQSEISGGVFDCGNPSINSLILDSYYATVLQHAYGYKVSCEGIVIGYYMLKFLKIKLDNCPESISDYRSSFCNDCFSVHIKYIAVDTKFQKQGLGSGMMKYIIKLVFGLCEHWPIRLITLDALKEKYEWYKSLGFLAFDEDDLTSDEATIHMYLDCLLNPRLVNNYSEMLY